MPLELLSPLIIVGTALGFVLLERIFPYDRRQKLFREGFFTDLVGYGLVQSYLLGLAIGALIRFLDEASGLSRSSLVGGWPLWVQVAFFFVVHDFYIYWFHRAQHWSDVLWRTHEAHHSGRDVDWLSGTRSHSLEILINQTIEFAPIVLLGAAPEVALIKATIDAVWGMFIHSNLRVSLGPLKWILNGPELHRWHHATELPMPGRNFGTKLAIWDRIFGTGWLPPHPPVAYGTDDPAYPQRGFMAWLRQHTYALRPFAASVPTPSKRESTSWET